MDSTPPQTAMVGDARSATDTFESESDVAVMLAPAASSKPQLQLTFRRGQRSDLPLINKLIRAEKLNPMDIKAERFMVAESTEWPSDNNGTIGALTGRGSLDLGLHQGVNANDTRGAQDAKAIGRSSDSGVHPGGGDTADDASAGEQNQGNNNSSVAAPVPVLRVCGFGQMQANGPGFWELRSIVVDHACRGQGVGKALVKELVALAAVGDGVYLTTSASKMDFYKPLGFQEYVGDQIPRFLWFRMVVAGWFAWMQGRRLVCMGLQQD